MLIPYLVFCEKNLEDCLRDTNRCAYFIKPLPVCAKNDKGINHKFDGFCDLHNVNECLGTNGNHNQSRSMNFFNNFYLFIFLAAFKASLCERV